MRSNSGQDESRNNMRDPTMRKDGGAKRRDSGSKLKAPADQRMGRKN